MLHDLVTSTRGARSVETISDELTQRRLRSVVLFEALSHRDLTRVANASYELRRARGTTVAIAGRRITDVLVVLDGYAGAEVDGVPAVVLGPGAAIGGPESLDGLASSFTVVAQTPLVLRVFPAHDFAVLVAGIPPLAMALIRQLGGRTRTVLDELVCARQGSVTPTVGPGASPGVCWSSSTAFPARNRRSFRYR